jgi:hypothetical protein
MTTIVHRAGGTMKLEKLSEYEHRAMNLEMIPGEDSVVLKCTEIKPQLN